MMGDATSILRILDDDDQPVELDILAFEEELADSFRRAGFADTWMAEDISLTVEEKLRIGGCDLMHRQDIDALVQSLLNAAGFQDVAREYASLRGNDFFKEERSNLKHWTDASLHGLLVRALPLEREQLDPLVAKCSDVLRSCGLDLATDKFVIGLALHLYLNDVKDLDLHAQEAVLASGAVKRREASNAELGYCRAMPYSSVFPKVRVRVDFGRALKELADGWIAQIGISLALEKLLPDLIETLECARRNLISKYPRLAETPATVLLTGISKADAENMAIPMLEETLSQKIDFPCLCIVRE